MQERVHIVVKRFSSTRTCRVSGVKTIRWGFVHTLKGRLKVTGNGRTVELVPGGLAYFPTRIPHAIYAEEPSVMMLTMVTPARDNIGD